MKLLTQGGRLVAAALVLSLALTGCGTDEPAPPAAQAAPSESAPPVVKPFNGVRPTNVKIPKIGAESSLVTVAIGKDGKMSVPSAKNPMQAAWYRLSPVPGDVGPAILLGHVDGNKQPGIFYKLKDVNPGDEILVDRSDGKVLKFVVEKKDQVPKDQFPEDAVYGNTDKPQLRVITCGGVFDKEEHSYKDNVIVYANLVA
ncbi:class F sortase [Amycolatopsis regifaucium]|uniref:Class F sortase n=1 Tax=Amycolatopsis regifaucium TaxID=546365 RepID=A0A154MSE5_9PSEU|nr:class F sortase [Amycolatopsis regifaucium]KZB86399.1 peptidase C60 [Amycolatopsis regifaucium]OKA06410.1 class F sortase [Amycolatopsis regifaucium]SFJ28464.1 Sortase (surface protein transpeptidase) [Amycolatopsis regifaucium]